MCTALSLNDSHFLFGRTLDSEIDYDGKITITPKNYVFSFRNGRRLKSHYPIIGMAHVADNYPLYFDAVNSQGLCMAGLNFVGNAYFFKEKENTDNVAVFEFIPWILSQCENVHEAKRMLGCLNLTDTPFREDLPTAPLHWMIADKRESITVECMKGGLHVYNNKIGVLTNNPPFEFQMHNLNNYMNLSSGQPENLFSSQISFERYSRGMGAIGLPGDLSSMSRFVRSAFVKLNSVAEKDELSAVNQFFHILSAVEQPRGCCKVDDKYEITIYSSCMDAEKGIYYCRTYENHQIIAVDMNREDLKGEKLKSFCLCKDENICFYN